jgi:endonuclease/exonuclease/phosphatase family metal-dependent hydrolase
MRGLRFGTVRRAAVTAAALAAGCLTASGPAAVAAQPAATTASAPATVKVMTWNVCANSKPRTDDLGQALCANGQQTDKVAAGIKWHIEQHDNLDAVLLQEICYADIKKLRDIMGSGWHFGFSGILDRGSGSTKGDTIVKRECVGGRGQFGVAVGVKASSVSFVRYHYATRNVPNARDVWGHWNVHQAAVCATALSTRFCGTHLTPWKGGHSDWSDQQASEFLTSQYGQVKELVGWSQGTSRVVLGGDLNSSPTRSSSLTGQMLDPLYDTYKECSQDAAGGARTGKGTFQNMDGTRGSKLDYLFTVPSAQASCYVTDKHVTLSDHVPVTATITF